VPTKESNSSHPSLRPLNAVLLAALGIAWSASSALAQTPTCGSVIGPGENLSLRTNILACDDGTGAAALTIVGPATVNMNGFIVSCADVDGDGVRPAGIVLEGSQVVLRNVGVSKCATGVFVEGAGQHRIEQVRASQNEGLGFLVESDRNVLVKNEARSNASGFRVTGNRNVLTSNQAFSHDGIAFRINGGDKNRFSRNEAAGNVTGFDVLSGSGNVLTANRARNNLIGFILNFSVGDKLVKNTATANRAGFLLFSDETTANANVATSNDDAGFAVEGRGNTLKQNRADDNGGDGIAVQFTATRALLRGNRASGNGGFDLRDVTDGCGTNRWEANTFESRSQTCIE
jgi:parallel beta-helix repeat protein